MDRLEGLVRVLPAHGWPVRLTVAFLAIAAVLLGADPQRAHAASFIVNPTLSEQGEPLRFQAEMDGPFGEGPFGTGFDVGVERIISFRINADRTTSDPGLCSGRKEFNIGWGQDVDVLGPDSTWTTGLGSFMCPSGLKPGNYIVSLDYRRGNPDLTSSIHTIDVKVSVFGDRDGDGIDDPSDNCPDHPNAGQQDADGDSIGDACDPDAADRDRDGVPNASDNCPDTPNSGQEDFDGDGLGNVCDPNPNDRDNDDVDDFFDNCPTVFNPSQGDTDGNGVGDACEPDLDGDGVPNAADNCPLVPNPDQTDSDLTPDGLGDACDPPDSDGDGVANESDNCAMVHNPDQSDSNGDGEGDPCDHDTDSDGDSVADSSDNCPARANPSQSDSDSDGVGDLCETEDTDGDGLLNYEDNCPFNFNPGQFDADGDGLGDACDPDADSDEDGVPDSLDNCDLVDNPGQHDANNNGIGDACDRFSDTDGDGLSDQQETVVGTDPVTMTPMPAGITTYTDGEPTGSSNPISTGEPVGVAILAPDGVDAVDVTVTASSGETAYKDILIPSSPVVFSFTAGTPGPWHIQALLFDDATLVATYDLHFLVIDNALPMPQTKDDCKKNGWKELYSADGTAFKNQGACVSYVSSDRQ